MNRQPNFRLYKPKVTGNLKKLGKEQKKIGRRKEIIKIKEEIIEKEMKETIVKINITRHWFFERINKIDKTLARLIKKKKKEESNQQN